MEFSFNIPSDIMKLVVEDFLKSKDVTALDIGNAMLVNKQFYSAFNNASLCLTSIAMKKRIKELKVIINERDYMLHEYEDEVDILKKDNARLSTQNAMLSTKHENCHQRSKRIMSRQENEIRSLRDEIYSLRKIVIFQK